MGSIKDPRTADFGAPSPAPEEDPRMSMRLDCPPDVAVSFLAKLYSAAPELHRTRPMFDRREGDPPTEMDGQR